MSRACELDFNSDGGGEVADMIDMIVAAAAAI